MASHILTHQLVKAAVAYTDDPGPIQAEYRRKYNLTRSQMARITRYDTGGKDAELDNRVKWLRKYGSTQERAENLSRKEREKAFDEREPWNMAKRKARGQ